MPVIDPVPLSDLPEELFAIVKRGRESGMLSSTVPAQIWAHCPEAASAWLLALENLHVHGRLGNRLRELVRLKIASITKCKACQVARKTDEVTEEDLACLTWSDSRFTPKEQAALRYAELFAFDYFAIDNEVHELLKRNFTTEETVELHMYCALMLAGGRMTYVQRGYPDQLDDDGDA